MKYYISDLHIYHENVIRYDGRPFSDVDEMSIEIVRKWNSTVKSDDEIYILGDFAWKNSKGIEVLGKLKGIKFLIKGNHDRVTEELATYFEWVRDYAVIQDGNFEVVMSHYPIAHWYNQYRGAIHLYGHVHNTKDYYAFEKYKQICRDMGIPFNCCNVGCMMSYMDYAPKTIDDLIKSGALY